MTEGVLSAGLIDSIMAKLETWTLNGWLPRLREIPSVGLVEGVNVAQSLLQPSLNQLIYTTAAVITELLGYKMKSYKEHYSPWRRWLEAKNKVAQSL